MARSSTTATTSALSKTSSVMSANQLSNSTITQRQILTSTPPSSSKLFDTNGNPFTFPTYTIQEIRSAIPSECYERSPLTGSLYILRDLLQIALVFFLAHKLITPEFIPSTLARIALWNMYGFINGLFGTGVWILAHECGHQAFSPSKVLNDTVGFVLHSMLLVPYFSWKISHGKHHKATAHLEKDTVHLPPTREAFAVKRKMAIEELVDAAGDAPLYSALYILQHNDASLPHYDSESWTFLRGAAASIDRDMGFLGRWVFHDIAETHVLHHYVSTIPHYHAEKASEAIRPVMGVHYRSDTRGGIWGFMKAMWIKIELRIFRNTLYLSPSPDLSRGSIPGKSRRHEPPSPRFDSTSFLG